MGPGRRRCAHRCDSRRCMSCFFFQAEDGIRDLTVTGVQTCALPILPDFLRALPLRAILDRPAARYFESPWPLLHALTFSPAAPTSPTPSPEKSPRSEEHTSELQSQSNIVCRLLLEKKKTQPHHAPAI